MWSGLSHYLSVFCLRHQPSSLYTFSFLSLARDCYFTRFPEFDWFYSERFRSGTPLLKAPALSLSYAPMLIGIPQQIRTVPSGFVFQSLNPIRRDFVLNSTRIVFYVLKCCRYTKPSTRWSGGGVEPLCQFGLYIVCCNDSLSTQSRIVWSAKWDFNHTLHQWYWCALVLSYWRVDLNLNQDTFFHHY